MKKRKLRLRKETVGHLSDDTLSRVAGADATVTCVTCIATEECDTSANTCGNSVPPSVTCSRPPSACASCSPTFCC